MASDSNALRRLLLGTVGWQRDDWLGSYYPDDIPPDWRLAYYANDCDCVMVSATEWRGRDLDMIAEQLEAAPRTLRCFFALDPADLVGVAPLLEVVGPERGVVLTARVDAAFDLLPQWVADGDNCWRDVDSAATMLRWPHYSGDLRAARARAEALDADAAALVVDGPDAGPADIQSLRTLFELLGRA